jgi:hypothetical protein
MVIGSPQTVIGKRTKKANGTDGKATASDILAGLFVGKALADRWHPKIVFAPPSKDPKSERLRFRKRVVLTPKAVGCRPLHLSMNGSQYPQTTFTNAEHLEQLRKSAL